MTARRELSLRHLIAAAAILLLTLPVVVWAYVESGLFNVAASRPHSKLVEWITHETMIHSVRWRARELQWPRLVTRDQAVRGFCQYEAHCVACHGAASVPREQWVSGLNPGPPFLLDATQHWTPDDLHWIVQNGIKMTAMPAWRDSMSEQQIRDVVVFLEAMPKMQPQTYVRWRNARVCSQKSI